MASNSRTLQDNFGEYSDWIELENTGTSPVDLHDWSLTDDALDLTKWRLPSTNLPPAGFLVVFASNRDCRTAGAPLHTNFKLDAGGEFLALVKPDGVTVASAFSPSFPQQVPDVSFGRGLLFSNTTLVSLTATGSVLVPTVANGGSALNYSWTGAAANEPFDTGTWRAATNGVGFSGSASLTAESSLALRFGFDAVPTNSVIVDSSPGGAHPGTNEGTLWLTTDGGRAGVAVFANDLVTVAPQADLNGTVGTLTFWFKTTALGGTGGHYRMLFDRRSGVGDVITLTDTGGVFVQATSAPGSVVNSFTASGNLCDGRWHHVAYVFDQATGGTVQLYIDGVLGMAHANAKAWAWDPARVLRLGGSPDGWWLPYEGTLDDFRVYTRGLTADEVAQIYAGDAGVTATDIGTNFQAEMLNVNASAFLRMPFTVSAPTNFSLLTLGLRYDDGFVAWINGEEVGRANAPATLGWDSAATASHPGGTAAYIQIANAAGMLRSGTNILALQGLNVASTNTTFLLRPELVASTVAALSTSGLYFTAATPGAANLGGASVPGPAITGVQPTPAVPLDDQDLVVTASVSPSFYAVSNVVMHYRIMYSPEVLVAMNDAGTNGDLVAGDGRWSATISASLSTPGQMIRYYVVATDVRTNVSRWPLFTDPADSAEYLGTIVNPTNLTSRLPVFHLFIHPDNQAAADSNAGSRGAFFYDGELYDNIAIHLRGNTTAQYTKKSHHLRFNTGQKLRHPGPGGRVKNTSLLAEYIDPSYLRQGLSFWLMEQAGNPAPFHYPVHVRLNGAFYQLAFHSDTLGEGQVERYGYDPRGAVYKDCGVINPAWQSPIKETRQWEGNADYVAFANAISSSQTVGVRHTNVFDVLDLPEVINYMAVAKLTQEEDDVWANMSLYRDSEGDHLWRIIPFDMNLSWGQLFGIDHIEATNDAFKSHPLYGNSACVQAGGPYNGYNNLYDAIMQVPQTRQMLLRRLRTLMDQFLQPPGTPSAQSILEAQIVQMTNLFHTEAYLDRAKWGWPWNGAPYNWGPNLWLTNGVEGLLRQFINPRRQHLYVTHCVTNTARAIGLGNASNAAIPLGQPANAAVSIIAWDFNPVSGNQEEEYVCLTNANDFAVDLSGWRLGGGVRYTFPPGTVIPSGSQFYVSPNVTAFRARAQAPRGGMGLFVIGNYQGYLSAWGEALYVTNAAGGLVSSISFPGDPSPAQRYLRVTEIMYNPAPWPALTNEAQQFEFVELKNISTNVALSLAGVRFANGIFFNFAGSTAAELAAGQTILVVRNLAAFKARYGNGVSVAGEFIGALENAGEQLRLEDAVGEKILDFTYDNAWYPTTDGGGPSLVIRDENGALDTWNLREGWRPSAATGGSPGVAEPAPPRPLVVPVARDGTAGVLISTLVGFTYGLEYKDQLADPGWSSAAAGVEGTGGSVTLIDPLPRSAGRFYRVRVW